MPNYLKDPDSLQIITSEGLTQKQEIFAEYQRTHMSSIIWLPIHFQNTLCLGLWIERWNVSNESLPSQETLNQLSRYLLPGYGAIWNKFC